VGINPISIGPIVGFIASTFLFAYQQYLFRTEQPDLNKDIQDLHKKIELTKIESSKELTELKTELAKFSLSMARVPGVVEKPKDKPKIQF